MSALEKRMFAFLLFLSSLLVIHLRTLLLFNLSVFPSFSFDSSFLCLSLSLLSRLSTFPLDSNSMGIEDYFPKVKRLRSETVWSPTFSAKLYDIWIYTSFVPNTFKACSGKNLQFFTSFLSFCVHLLIFYSSYTYR